MDESELRVQLEQHHAASYGWALSCCSRIPELSEDVLHTAYLKILQGRARYDGRATFKTWLFAVIRTTTLDEQRRLWLRGMRAAEYKSKRESGRQESEQAKCLDHSELLNEFQQVLARLSKRQQEIMHLVFYQDMSLQEASDVLGISLGSARTHYERGKRNLRVWLEQSDYFHDHGQDREEFNSALP